MKVNNKCAILIKIIIQTMAICQKIPSSNAHFSSGIWIHSKNIRNGFNCIKKYHQIINTDILILFYLEYFTDDIRNRYPDLNVIFFTLNHSDDNF